MKKSSVMAGILSIVLLTTGVLSVKANYGPFVDVTVPGFNGSKSGAPQDKKISNHDGFLYVSAILWDYSLDARAEKGALSNRGPWVRVAYEGRSYLLKNSIKKDDNIQVRFSSDLTTYVSTRVLGNFDGN